MLTFAPARERALAQFSAPYDPDFAQQSKAPEPEAVPAAVPEEALPIVIPAAGTFLLLERTDKDHIFERPSEATAPQPEHDFLKFTQDLKPFTYSQEKFIQARTGIEQGRIPAEGEAGELITGETEVSTATTLRPPPPELELPAHQMSLSITGRKIIGFSFSEKRFTNDQKKTGRPATTNLFDIQQELQLRMQGKVGPKISVNVDYDDTKVNQQDISVVYRGDPNEVVQNVSFGDIDLSLPPTEFVSYNKQLFGIRADIKYKGLNASFIGSRTKGTTKIKQFIGNTQFASVDIADTNYIRRQHYDLTFGVPTRLPLRSGTERIYLAQQNVAATNVNEQDFTVDDLVLATATFTGKFIQLFAGADYTIDYVKGILSLRNQLQPQFVLAVDYLDAQGNSITVQTSSTSLALGGTGRLKLIKTLSDLPITCSSCTADETGFNRELKTTYNIGQPQIVRDNGRGNFILKVLDQQRVEVGSALNPPQKYPDTILVDFENGTFRLDHPFAVEGDSSTADPQIYAPTPISKRLLHVDYSYRLRTFFLEPSMVVQSEVVLLDNIKLNRNVDYFIDYESGFITFFNPDRIGANSEVDISYEVSPFGGISNESLLGTRVSYDLNKHVSMGSTLLYQAGAKSQTVPSITELARSLMVYDFDLKLRDIRLTRSLTASFAGEFAQSRQNLNLNGFALIDNMEGIRQDDAAGIMSQQWQVASNPNRVPADPKTLSWFNEDVNVLDINPRAQSGSQESQKVLDFSYDFNAVANSTEEVSIVFPFNVAGLDFSQKNLLEVVMLGDKSDNLINFRLGGIDENADGAGGMTLHCSDGRIITGAPKTEDLNCDGILQSGEDLGWTYAPPGSPNSQPYGLNNGLIDSEDLSQNSRLDPDDGNGADFGYMCMAGAGGLCTTGTADQLPSLNSSPPHTKLDFGTGKNWETIEIPLNISTATLTRWNAIKQIRVSIKRGPGGNASGTVKFARIGVVGTTWQRGLAGDPATGQSQLAGESLIATPINSVDNPTYTPIFNAGGDATGVFNDLYGSLAAAQQQSGTKNLSEQALQLDCTGLAIVGGIAPVVFTKRLFTKAIDISQHRYFDFLLYGNADNSHINTTDHMFFLRAGNDSNFFEVQAPLNFSGWRKIIVEQLDTNSDSVMDSWRAKSPGAVIITSGTPSLQQIAQLVAGVRKTQELTSGAGIPSQARLYLNEIFVAEPVVRVGNAESLQADFDWSSWASFGFKHRFVDRNFQTPTSVVSNQDNRQDNAYLNFKRITFFPMSFTLSRALTDTPSTVQTGNLSNLVNSLQGGKVTTWNGSAQGNFTLGSWPRLALSHTRNFIDYDLLTRTDDRRGYTGSLQYGVPWNLRVLPKTIDSNYSYSLYEVKFNSLRARKIPGNANTEELSQSFGLRLSFTPWEGSSFNPNYSISKVTERRSDFTGDVEKQQRYPKSMTQNVGFASNFRLTRWLNPQVNYSVDVLENNILSVSTFIVLGSTYVFDVGDIKTVNRSANGSASLPLTIGDIFPSFKPLRSMNIISGYQLQDGDVWNNVPRGYQTNMGLWVRTPLRPHHPVSQRMNQTLRDTFNSTQRWSPLEAYNLPGRTAAFKTLSVSNNYVRSIQRSDVTGTISKTLSTTFPDLVASISQLEQLWFAERWMGNSQMNFRFSAHKTENVGSSINTDEAFGTDLRTILFRRLDTLLSYNNRSGKNRDLRIAANTQTTSHEDATAQVNFNIRKFYFTPKTDYSHDDATLGTGVKSQDITVITPSLLVRTDLALPRGLLLPGAKKPILFSNRVIWTTTMSLAKRSSPLTEADNSMLFNLNTSGDYEIAKNLRLTLNGAMSRLWHRFLKEEDFISYQLGTMLTFQF